MKFLTPDRTYTLGGVAVHEYLLTAHNPNHITMPSGTLPDKPGITIHNTDTIRVPAGTSPAEQYTRATVNGNMRDVRVHFYVDHVCAWQCLPLTLPGWHAADGNGPGNRTTIAIECIMSGDGSDSDRKAEDNCARLAAALLRRYGHNEDMVFTHTYWLHIRDGNTGNDLRTRPHSYKTCPAYIIPHWDDYIDKVQGYLTGAQTIYRVRRTWSDAASQIGAYTVYDNAVRACTASYAVYDPDGRELHRVLAEAEAEQDIDAVAWAVIRGNYGNGAERKRRLAAAGYDYKTVQQRVNELLKQM